LTSIVLYQSRHWTVGWPQVVEPSCEDRFTLASIFASVSLVFWAADSPSSSTMQSAAAVELDSRGALLLLVSSSAQCFSLPYRYKIELYD